jgi:segregation and condensation protein B
MNNDLNKKIESYLFWKNEPVNLKDLMKIFQIDKAVLDLEINNLQERYKDSGLSLKLTDEKITITTSPETSELIDELIKEDLNKDLSKATIETLSIIIYRGPIKKSEIDYIRGVSSQFILRNLQTRGLIDKISDPNDSRSYLYKPSIELLNYLGINQISEISDYQAVNNDIDNYLNNSKEIEQDNTN